MEISFCSFKPYGMSSVFYILQCCVCFVSFTMKCCQESGLLSISMLKVIQIFAVLYFHVFDKMTKRRIKKKKNKDGHVHVGGKKGRMNI